MTLSLRKEFDCGFCQQLYAGWLSYSKTDLYKFCHSHCKRCSKQAFDSILCAVCRHLRISHVFFCNDSTLIRHHGFLLGILKEIDERSSRCCFCRFISDICHAELQIRPLDNALTRSITIDVTWRSKIYCRIFTPFDYTQGQRKIQIKSWVPSAGAVSFVDQIARRSQYDPTASLEEYVDWDKVRQWMHNTSVSTEDNATSGRPKNLKVIDVIQDRVVHAPADCEYLALSYVFGGVKTIKLPSSRCIEKDHLPATIRDAIVACDRLGYRFLWIDQLCIDQGNRYEVQEQIDQMNRIYQHAACTLVALEGEDSNHGLPGVTVPRLWQHSVVEMDRMAFVNRSPSLNDIMEGKKWLTRGWTLQEEHCSSAMLFLTSYGVYYSHSSPVKIESETIHGEDDLDQIPIGMDYWRILEQYTKRQLSYQSDILRAFTAVLQATHGDRTYYGLPLDYIDQAMVWVPKYTLRSDSPPDPLRIRDEFPSWSWTSHLGPITHLEAQFGLAIWAIPQSTTTVTVCKPIQTDQGELLHERWHENYYSKRRMLHKLVVAWVAGCVQAPFPIRKGSYSSVDFILSSEFDYMFPRGLKLPERLSYRSLLKTLHKRWPTYSSYWHDAFGEWDAHKVFAPPDRELAYAVPGRILFHGQSAYFYLEPFDRQRSGSGEHDLWIRSRNGLYVGNVAVPHYHRLPIKNGLVEFILLCIADKYQYCSWPPSSGAPSTTVDKSVEHICNLLHDYHPQRCADLRPESPEVFEKVAKGMVLSVMLIKRDPKTNVARRLGIGSIYLKRWVDAGPHYKTVILE